MCHMGWERSVQRVSFKDSIRFNERVCEESSLLHGEAAALDIFVFLQLWLSMEHYIRVSINA